MRKSLSAGTIAVLVALWVVVPVYTASEPLSDVEICLDPGHGGADPGAVNTAYSLEEADINLDVAYGLKALLEGDGATVLMTRSDDSDKSNSDRYTYCNTEQATILVSIHTNSVTDPSWDGSLALYGPKEDPALARAIHDPMYKLLRDTAPVPDEFRDFGVDRYASGVLFKSDMPAAMMEPLFMSNPAEAELLVTPIYTDYGVTANPGCVNCRRAQIAQAIHEGILAYLSPAEPGGVMHVDGIEVSLEQKGVWTNAAAAVHIVDAAGDPVAGATVSGHWTGSTTDEDTGTTDENGITILRSDRTRDTSGTFTFVVDDVSKDGWTYNPEGNVESSDSIGF